MLYIVPTPIGNLDDMTFRAIKTLKHVQLILAEDTRTSGKLMKHFDIETPMRSFHSFNEHKVLEDYVRQLEQGADIALISDAGTPGISDPGYLLIRACVEAEVNITCLPGATAFVPALVASGIPCDKFFYEGFLPHKKGRMTRLKFLCELEYTFVLYESPHRLIKCLKELAQHCGDNRRASVVREISKLHEEQITKPLEVLIKEFESRPSIKGEIAIVVEGKTESGKEKREKNQSKNKYRS